MIDNLKINDLAKNMEIGQAKFLIKSHCVTSIYECKKIRQSSYLKQIITPF